MRNRFRFLGPWTLAVCALSVVALIACTAPAAPEPAEDPACADDSQPATAGASGTMQEIPVSAFVQQHAEISESWDRFHGDFDEWSASLSSCHPNAMREAVNGFAVSFNDVTQQARGLTRGKTSGEIADLLIVAAEEEEAAFRQLRDRWHPNNIALFENVDQHRTKASQAQNSAEDRVIELRDGFEDAADPEATAEFLEAFEPIRDDWKQLHDDYETLSDDADDLGAAAVTEGIDNHVAGLEAIIDALEELPELEGAEDTVEALMEAAKAELEAFEGGTGSSSTATSTASTATSGTADSESTGSTSTESTESTSDTGTSTTETAESTGTSGSNGSGSTGNDGQPDLEALDAIVEANAKVLKDGNRTIEDLADPDAERGLAELQVFDTEYARLIRNWDAFHDEYNEWRGNDGGCDRAQVVQQLEEHSLRIAEIARDVRTLPSAGQLLPIYSLLTEAAARDENAIRTLRYTWQPFALDASKAVHEERTDTERIRRQAEIAVQELANRS